MSQNQWNKDRIRKLMVDRKTYKELQPVLIEVANKNQKMSQFATEAILQQLKSGNTSNQLAAIRFAKDCFELAYPPFINEIIGRVAPQMLQIVTQLDKKKDKKINDQTILDRIAVKNSDSDLYSFCLECLKNWDAWLDEVGHTPNLKEIASIIEQRKAHQKFFIFTNKKSFVNEYIRQSSKKVTTNNDIKKEIDKIIKEVEQLVRDQHPSSATIIRKLEERLDTAMDQYCKLTANFDENYMNSCYQRFENFKRQAVNLKKIDQDVAKGLPQKAFFKQDTEEEEEPPEIKPSPKTRQKNLNIIAEEENESEVSNLKSPPNQLFLLQQKKQQLEQENKKIQMELEQLRNHHSLSIENSLTQQLMQLRRKKFQKSQELSQLQQQIIKRVYHQPKLNDSPVRMLSMTEPQAKVLVNRHPYDKIADSLLQRPNIITLKKCILKSNGSLYEDNSMAVSVEMRQQVNNSQDIIQLNMTYEMQNKSYNNQFKISSEFDIWARNLQLKRQDKITYGQQITVKRTDNTTLSILKIRSKQIILPLLFLNFLRHGEVSASAFDAVIKQPNIRTVEEQGLKLDKEICKGATDIKKYFSQADIITTREYDRARCVFILPSTEQLVFSEIRIYRGQAVNIYCMEIVEKTKKLRLAGKLLRDLAFLFTVS